MALQILKRELWYRLQGVGYTMGFGRDGGAVPHVHKRHLIGACRRRYGLRIFIETGTYLGDMVAAQARHFAEVHSIELSPQLHERAQQRFAGRSGITLHCGDSGTVLRRVLAGCSEPALFWLDAHYSGGITHGSTSWVPVLDELDAILGHTVEDHVILIDDARLFDGTQGYPALVDLTSFIAGRRRDLTVDVVADVIRILPAGLDAKAHAGERLG